MKNPLRIPAAVAIVVFAAACGTDKAAVLSLGQSSSESRSANSGAAMSSPTLPVTNCPIRNGWTASGGADRGDTQHRPSPGRTFLASQGCSVCRVP